MLRDVLEIVENTQSKYVYVLFGRVSESNGYSTDIYCVIESDEDKVKKAMRNGKWHTEIATYTTAYGFIKQLKEDDVQNQRIRSKTSKYDFVRITG